MTNLPSFWWGKLRIILWRAILLFLTKISQVLTYFWLGLRFLGKFFGQWLFQPFLFLFFRIYFRFGNKWLKLKKICSSPGNLLPTSWFFYSLIIFLTILILVSETTASESGRSRFIHPFSSQSKEILIKETAPKQKIPSGDFKIAADLEKPEEDFDPALALGGAALINPELVIDENFSPTRTEIEKYIIQPGDTLSSIAEKFGVSIDSLLWENKLTLRSILRPGQELSILPMSGLTHKVKKGDTIAKIVQLYKSNPEEIIEFNNLTDEGDIFEGDILIIPDGRMPPPPAPRQIVSQPKPKSNVLLVEGGLPTEAPQGQNCHKFVPGQCTWYVAKKYCIPWTGHAKQWLANARRMGYEIGSEPRVGAIMSRRESWYGHVVYVERFDDSTVTFSEMNYLGRPYVITRRTVPRNDPLILGYIYMD